MLPGAKETHQMSASPTCHRRGRCRLWEWRLGSSEESAAPSAPQRLCLPLGASCVEEDMYRNWAYRLVEKNIVDV